MVISPPPLGPRGQGHGVGEGVGGWAVVVGEASGSRPRPLLDAPEETHGKDHGEKLNGQHPYGEGSSQVDVGFKSVEDHCVTALGRKDQKRGHNWRQSGVRGQHQD